MFEYLRDVVGDEFEASELTPKLVLAVVLVGALAGAILSSTARNNAS